MSYSAVIRVDHCSDLLREVVGALSLQSAPPAEIVFVDSSGDSAVRRALEALGDVVVAYPPREFNFSHAINLGAQASSHETILLISSHVMLADAGLVERALAAQARQGAFAAYICHAFTGVQGEWTIDARSFDGFNGLSNSCSLLPRQAVLDEPFREEVFSAEDQEWAARMFRLRNARIVRIEEPRLLYLNPNFNATKQINEEIAVAYFACRRRLGPTFVAARLGRALLALSRRRHDRARMHWAIARGLVAAWFVQPRRRSKYY